MKKLLIILSIVSAVAAPAPSLLDLQRLNTLTPSSTNVLTFAGVPTSATVSTPYKLHLSLTNLSIISGKSILSVDAINSQAKFEAALGWTITSGVSAPTNTLVVLNGAANKLTYFSGVTNATATDITVSSLTNLSNIGTLTANRLETTDITQTGGSIFYDADQTHTAGIGAPSVVSSSVYMLLPSSPLSGILYWTTSSTNMTPAAVTIGSGLTFAGGTLSATGLSDNWVASGTTNSTLAGNAYVHNLYITNNLTILSNGAPVLLAFGDADDSAYFSIMAHPTITSNNVLVSTPAALADGSILKITNDGTTYTNSAGTAFRAMYLTNAIAGTDYFNKSGSSAANDIAVFTGTGLTLARSTTAGTLGDSSGATYTLTFGLSGATDPVITAANNLLTVSTPLTVAGLTSSGGATVAAGTSYATSSRGSLKFNGDGILAAYNSAGTDFSYFQFGGTSSSFPALKRSGTGLISRLADDSANAPFTAGTLTLTPAAADTSYGTWSGGSTTGSATTKAFTSSWTANTSGNIDGVYTFTLVDTASGASTKHSQWFGGAAGTTSLMSLDKNGNIVNAGGLTAGGNIQTIAGGSYLAAGRGGSQATANGVWRYLDTAGTGFTSLTLGPDDSSPNSASLKGASGVGTDIAGGTLNIDAGISTGTGRGGALVGRTSISSSTGSSANTQSERYHYAAKAVTLTSATATTIATIACPTAKFVGGECVVTVWATDGTDHQTRTLTFPFSAINKAGTVTAGFGTPVESIAVSAGTLTATITTVANGNAVDIKVNADSSLTETTLSATIAFPGMNSNDTAAVTEI